MTFDIWLLVFGEWLDGVGRVFGEWIIRVVYEGFNKIILREGGISKLRPGCKFLEVKLDGNEPSNNF